MKFDKEGRHPWHPSCICQWDEFKLRVLLFQFPQKGFERMEFALLGLGPPPMGKPWLYIFPKMVKLKKRVPMSGLWGKRFKMEVDKPVLQVSGPAYHSEHPASSQ